MKLTRILTLTLLLTTPLFAEQETDIEKFTEALKLLLVEKPETAETNKPKKPVDKKDFSKIFAACAQYIKDKGSKDPRINAILENIKQDEKPKKE